MKQPLLSVALTSKVKVPVTPGLTLATVAVPLPLSVKVKVLGTAVALSSTRVHGAVPPETLMFWLYAV